MRRLIYFFNNFFASEKSGGFILVLCSVFSVIASNSFFGTTYQHFWHTTLFSKPLEFWINDALMSIFFLLIGLEIERELYVGELSNLKNALLPISAAVGGMLVPALIFFFLNHGTVYQNGIAIPTATDIAFSLSVLSLLGNRVPASLKVFLSALAIVDDLGAIIIIAVFYTKSFSGMYLGFALLILGVLFFLNRLKIHSLSIFIALGIILWICVLKSGIHPTIAGVLLAFVIPFRGVNKISLSNRVEHALHKPVAYFILPLFALANTCVVLPHHFMASLTSTSSLGIMLGLIVGKPLGIVLFSAASIAFGISVLPENTTIKQLFGVSLLAGIGFTMSIFITLLAFNDTRVIDDSKIAILIASLISGVLGYFFLKNIFIHDTKPIIPK